MLNLEWVAPIPRIFRPVGAFGWLQLLCLSISYEQDSSASVSPEGVILTLRSLACLAVNTSRLSLSLKTRNLLTPEMI